MQTAPTTIRDRYVLLERLDSGGVTALYRGEDAIIGRPVAVKVVADPAVVHIPPLRFRLEVAAIARLVHPAIVRLLGGGTDGARAYLVTELVEAPSLEQLLAGAGPLDAVRVRDIARQVTGALVHAHAAGCPHLELRPRNVLVGDTVRVTDFGVRRLLYQTLAATTTHGTVTYLAPEQVAGGPVGPPADVYALGLILLELLTGEPAFPGPSSESAVARLGRVPDVPGDLPEPWPELLSAMTVREPALRPNATHVAGVLDGESRPWAAPVPAGATAPRAAGAPGRGPRRRAWNAVAALGVALLLLAGWLSVRGTEAADVPGALARPVDDVADEQDEAANGRPAGGLELTAGAQDREGGLTADEPSPSPAGRLPFRGATAGSDAPATDREPTTALGERSEPLGRPAVPRRSPADDRDRQPAEDPTALPRDTGTRRPAPATTPWQPAPDAAPRRPAPDTTTRQPAREPTPQPTQDPLRQPAPDTGDRTAESDPAAGDGTGATPSPTPPPPPEPPRGEVDDLLDALPGAQEAREGRGPLDDSDEDDEDDEDDDGDDEDDDGDDEDDDEDEDD